MTSVQYMSGFGNEFVSEALPGVVPKGRNSPQRVAGNLYAEQLSGTAFTAPRALNRRSWLYRIRPGAQHAAMFRRIDAGLIRSAPSARRESDLAIGQRSWTAPAIPTEPTNFLQGLRTLTTAGDVDLQNGFAFHIGVLNRSMENEYFVNIDGELLVIAQRGRLRFRTEFGLVDIEPEEICVIPRGVTFAVDVLDGPARVYVCENYGRPLVLPELGPIGANGLANPRDFLVPVAAYEDRDDPGVMIVKSGGDLYASEIDRSPLDVVGWHGNYTPYKYDLRNFCPMGSINFDHQDPSIFTVLTSPSEVPGHANIDFVLFGDRWLVAEDTFRPAWYHRNYASEFMGMFGDETKPDPNGFGPGGYNLHNQLLPHGVDADTFERESTIHLEPRKVTGRTMFMLETRFQQHLTRYAADCAPPQQEYLNRWSSLQRKFSPTEA